MKIYNLLLVINLLFISRTLSCVVGIWIRKVSDISATSAVILSDKAGYEYPIRDLAPTWKNDN